MQLLWPPHGAGTQHTAAFIVGAHASGWQRGKEGLSNCGVRQRRACCRPTRLTLHACLAAGCMMGMDLQLGVSSPAYGHQ